MICDVKNALILACVVGLTACSHGFGNDSYFHNNDTAYLNSSNGRPLVVPPPLTKQNITSFYLLPNQNQNAVVNAQPPGLAESSAELIYVPGIKASQIKRVDGGLLVTKSIGQVWSIVGSALRRKSIPITKADGKRMIYYVSNKKGQAANYRVNLYPKGDYDTLIVLTDIKGARLTETQIHSIREQLSYGMQGKSSYSVTRLLGVGE